MSSTNAPPECLNASDFMWAVIQSTPARMREVQGIVNVDACLRIDETGAVTIKSVACNTVSGRLVERDDAEIIRAALAILSLIRFRPAVKDGVPVAFEDFPISFGYTTLALETAITARDRRRSESLNN